MYLFQPQLPQRVGFLGVTRLQPGEVKYKSETRDLHALYGSRCRFL